MSAAKKIEPKVTDLHNPRTQRGMNILSVKVPKEMESPIKTGILWFDVATGGEEEPGMLASTVTLFTGVPGGGKTTLGLQLAESIHSTGNICLYNTGEQSLFAVRKATKRLGSENGFIVKADHKLEDIIAHFEWLREKYPNKKIFGILDSLQVIDDGFYKDGAMNSKTPVRVMERLAAYASTSFVTIIVIGQVTKSGEFAGKQAVKHHADAHCQIKFDLDKKSDTYGQRIFGYTKNRNGPITVQGTVLNMTAQGLVPSDKQEATFDLDEGDGDE